MLRDGWPKYFGLRIPAEEIYCDGCMAENPILIDQSCLVRPRVLSMGLENCSQCEQCEQGCEKLTERLVSYDDVQRRVGGEIPQADYQLFIHPYENKRRLDALRG